MIWTEENVATLKRMWEAGDGGTAIADHFTRQGYACSRNACIGAAHRAGFQTPNKDRSLRASKAAATKRFRADSHRTESVRKARIAAIKRKVGVTDRATKQVPVPTTAPEPMHLTLMELTEHTCKFPYGDKPFTFCGHPKDVVVPYCSWHQRMTWVPARDR